MPYGVDKHLGGDNKENDSFMEQCVKKVMKTGKDKSSAIAICKASLAKSKGKKAQAEFIIDQITKG